MTNKTCPICKINKPVDEFHSYFSKAMNKTRIGNYCKLCARETSKVRVKKYFEDNKEARLQYAREYRADPKNKEKLHALDLKFGRLYREKLQPCYLRDVLVQKYGFEYQDLHQHPEIVEAYKYQILIKRKLKQQKDVKK